jgi:putative DNA primase/helicase
MTVHRAYLGEDGGKAKIQNPKKAYSDFKGGAIWFGAPMENGELVKAEGPENALACFMAGRTFVASSVGGSNLKNVIAPASIRNILIAGDRGRNKPPMKAGEDFAEDATIAARKQNVLSAISYPPARPAANGKWQDWNDLLLSDGLDAVREALAQSEPWEDLPSGFRWQQSGRGIEYLKGITADKSTGEEEEVWEWLCSEADFLAMTLNPDSKDWGLSIKIKTRNAVWHTIAITKADLVTNSEDIFKVLAYHGLDFNISPRAKNRLKELLNRVRAKSYALCVPRIGFHDGVFVLPNDTIGDTKGRAIVFQSSKPIDHFYRRGGSLKGWQERIAAYASGNGRLMFAIAAAFAPPLLELIGMEGGGIHFRGGSSAGKTTILRAAGTVWGGGGQHGFIRTWRATDNALEAVAANHNNALLLLDEIAEIDPKPLFKAAYALANGRQKDRMQKTADLRSASTWRLLFMSTGEISIADKLSEDRMRATGGQAVRIVEIAADAGYGMGMFQTLHGFKEPKQLADALNAASREHYGHAAPAFIAHLTSDLDRLSESTKAFIARFVEQSCAKEADGQVSRVAQRFGLIAAAGELAITARVVPWKRGEVREICKQLFAEWVAARGTAGPIETQNGLQQVRSFIELHGSSRFTPWHTPNQTTINRVGFFRVFDPGSDNEKVTYYVLPEGWKEICRGYDAKAIASAMVDRRIIDPDNEGKFQRKVRLPGMGSRRCYEIDGARLFDDSAEPREQSGGSAWKGRSVSLSHMSTSDQ